MWLKSLLMWLSRLVNNFDGLKTTSTRHTRFFWCYNLNSIEEFKEPTTIKAILGKRSLS